MLEIDQKYKRGSNTLVHLYVTKCWIFLFLSVLFFWFWWKIAFGSYGVPLQAFLDKHPTWYINSGMVGEWVLLLGLALLLFSFMRAYVYYNQLTFKLTEHAFHLKKGVFMTREITIPYHQINNVHVIRPYHFRMLGLSRVDIVTASDRMPMGHIRKPKDFLIPIIDASMATLLSHHLIQYSSKNKNDFSDDISDDDIDDANDETIV